MVSGASRWSYRRRRAASGLTLPALISSHSRAVASATDLCPTVKAFGVSIVEPPVLVALLRIVRANFGPPLDGSHVSVWSRTAKTARAPLTDVADDVRRSILPRRSATKESIGSTPYSSCAGEPRSISSSGSHVLAV